MTYDFDAWRERYDSMTYQDHLDAYSELWKLYPVQQHFDARATSEFLDLTKPERVFEVGGWNGELAYLMLATHPTIRSWENVEICREAAQAIPQGLLGNGRYRRGDHPHDRFIWETEDPFEADALVMSHSAEHMRWIELQALIGSLHMRSVYLASPLPTDGSAPDWNHYPGTHILEVGWDSIGAFLGGLGFRQMVAPRTHEVRAWAKI